MCSSVCVCVYLCPVELKTVGVGLLVIGGVVAVVSVVGCLGAHNENQFLLLMYLSFLIILVLGQLFVTFLLVINKRKIEDSLDEDVDQIIIQYGDSRDYQHRLMDNVQRNGKCCGRTGPRDWLQNSFIQSLNLTNPDVLPCSCFNSSHPTFNSSWCSELLSFTEPLFGRGNSSYDQGCKKKFMDWLKDNALTIIGMDVSLMLSQVVQFVLAVYLYQAFGQKAALKRTNPLVDLDVNPDPDSDYGEQNYAYMDPNLDYIDPAHPAYYHDNPNHGDPTNLAYHQNNQM
ncbi:hypothetical protein PAMP_002481 [Pampus punctatissimus]